MDIFIEKFRVMALQQFCLTYILGIEVATVQRLLAFDTRDEAVALIHQSGKLYF